jgi:hypothetical protein
MLDEFIVRADDWMALRSPPSRIPIEGFSGAVSGWCGLSEYPDEGAQKLGEPAQEKDRSRLVSSMPNAEVP